MQKQTFPYEPSRESSPLHPVLVSLMAVCILCLRPSMIGELYSLQASALLCVLVAVYFGVSGGRFLIGGWTLAYAQLTIFAIALLQWFILSAGAGGIFADYALKGLPMSVATVIAIFIAISNPSNARVFFDTLAIVILASCACVVITFTLMAVGVPWHSLVYGNIQGTSYSVANVMFPFTFAGNLTITPFGILQRCSGIFREPGVLPAFACWSAGYAFLRKWPLWASAIALAASVASFSTLGLPLAAFTGAMIILRRAKIPTLLSLGIVGVLGLIAFPIFNNLEFFGLDSKLRSRPESFVARTNAIQTGFSARNMVFGDGPTLNGGADDAVNLIGRTRFIGVFGVLAALAPYFLVMGKDIFLVGLIPIVGAILVSQPIANDAPAFVICLSWIALTPLAQASRRLPNNNAFSPPSEPALSRLQR